ncbi:tyrosine--tRNA ligase [Cellvibrio japonicus]|uniref:Tyrosine--tRNA ligase n=1 Tax=Cellvibrio japonicus (strain Ueda107) TaxID=498211 RepID=B3PL79_CELJU|nr:tyrosine--tRNA ligase [Cellvibrio japonicus]ACE84130.1 tyrosyl-tRNA synthetase [Cellvibrio japonicus Ueda107]QEI11539.1 tyrosine--tRNA ligase [Cellvibrio japonicus]QEI15113.1 tyrosine--tRNA ligase [Cellvibrio japonicus]QEI18693.1 tyrosine--tRNA ligase [Cellvibrio japonicus]
MTSIDTHFLQELQERGLIAQMTGGDSLAEHLNTGSRTLYSGFDPTADSLHIGHLVPLLALKRFQMAGHKPIALVGGATGLVGDPSFKAQERKLNTPDVVAGWVQRLQQQVSRFIDFDCGPNSAEVVNNLDWVGNMNVLSFLRDVGKHFSVNNMINKESVKQRIEREGEGISFTEFTYMLLQSYDFAELYQRRQCTLQIGGSDQWGNITGGIDLTRRLHGGQVFGLTMPLVTKADGTKFGKTETGTVWLDPVKTSPYAFYQFWLGAADADVYKFLRYFTFLHLDEIARIEAADVASGVKPQAQRILAEQMTELVHGKSGLEAAQRITQALFSDELSGLSESDFLQLQQDGLPTSRLVRAEFASVSLIQLLTEAQLATSGKQVKDALQRSAVFINGAAKGEADNMDVPGCFAWDTAFYERFYLVKLGKKKCHLFEVV